MTLLIKNVLIADRENSERSDILVRGDKIAAIGNIQMKNPDEVFDGQGAFVSSGFIDVHSIADRTLQLFKHPGQDEYLKQGVTSAIGGHGGLSLAPLVYGDFASIREWADPKGVNVDWATMAEFLKAITKLKPGINFGSLSGYSTMREALVGDSERALTKNENAVLEAMFRKSMADGSLGISMGMGSIHGRKISITEARSLIKKVRKETVQTFEYDPESNSIDDLGETLELAAKVGSRLIVNGLDSIKEEAELKQALDIFSGLPAKSEIYFSISPREKKIVPLYKFLPLWAKKGNMTAMAKSLEDEWLGEKIFKELSVKDVDDMVIVGSKRNAALNGLTLREYAGHHGHRTFKKALFKLMQATKLDALVSVSSEMDQTIKQAVRDNRSLIASSEASFYGSPKGSHGRAFLNFISGLGGENQTESIRKITSIPAGLFNLNSRGTVKEGYFADLVVFKGEEIKFVSVNGIAAFKEGQSLGSRSGIALKG